MEIFYEYKDKIINASDNCDGTSILNDALKLTTNHTEQKLLESLINDDTYNIKMDLDKFIIYLNILDFIYYYDDAQKILEDILQQIKNTAQVNTLKRIIKNKPIKQSNNDLTILLNKQCPHCDQKTYGNATCYYLICGYNIRGFDWKGCGRDWCFICGKKLCKSWNINSLFNQINRYHNGKCCKKYATTNGFKYPDDFCMCQSNEFVDRLTK